LRILAWDTATDFNCAALIYLSAAGDCLALEEFQSERGVQAQTLPPELARMLKKHSLRPADLDLLAVGRGPGSFTGLRSGLALAKGLALGGGLPLMGLASTETLAGLMLFEDQTAAGDFLAAPLIDARHREIFTALYQARPGGGPPALEELWPPQALPPAEIPRRLSAAARGRPVRLAGPALDLLLAALPGGLPDGLSPGPAGLAPRAAMLARLAGLRYQRDESAAALYPPLPLYIRQPDLRRSGAAPGPEIT
jgi:tRNA threonylcarbamoyladenosine biosynthesis protein TsaB